MENVSNWILFGILIFLGILEWIFIKIDKRTGIGRTVKWIFNIVAIIIFIALIIIWLI